MLSLRPFLCQVPQVPPFPRTVLLLPRNPHRPDFRYLQDSSQREACNIRLYQTDLTSLIQLCLSAPTKICSKNIKHFPRNTITQLDWAESYIVSSQKTEKILAQKLAWYKIILPWRFIIINFKIQIFHKEKHWLNVIKVPRRFPIRKFLDFFFLSCQR